MGLQVLGEDSLIVCERIAAFTGSRMVVKIHTSIVLVDREEN